MIRLVLNADSTAGLRFATSPALETVELVRMVGRIGNPREVQDPWLRQLIDSMGPLGLDELTDTVISDGYHPDFLTPAPGRGSESRVFHDQLESVGSTPLDMVDWQLAMAYQGRTRNWAEKSPEKARRLLADQLARCYRHVVRPRWPKVEAIARTDIRSRIGRSASDGLARVLDDLHPRIRFRDAGIEFSTIGDFHEEIPIGDDGLLLVPSVFDRHPGLCKHLPGPMQFVYPARGSAALYERDMGSSALATVLGSTRVAMLAAAVEPTTTTDLAAQLDLAPATVSYHLTAMADIGWLVRRRVGRTVEYEATELGRMVLDGHI